MTKKQFLATLHRRLMWKYSADQVYDIMSDFKEYFDTGVTEGKTEEELCAEFGSPKEIALAIRPKQEKAITLSLPAIVRIGLVCLLVVSLRMLLGAAYPGVGLFPTCTLCIIIIPLILAFIVKGNYKIWDVRDTAKNSRNAFIISAVLCFVFILLYFFLRQNFPQIMIDAIEQDQLIRLAVILSYVIRSFYGIVIISLLLLMQVYRNFSSIAFLSFFFGVGILCGAINFEKALMTFESSELFRAQIDKSFIFVGIGLLCSILAFISIKLLARKVQ